MKIKNVVVLILLVSMGFIVYFFIKEQFNDVVLTRNENIFLSILYLIVGISVFVLIGIKNLQNKKK